LLPVKNRRSFLAFLQSQQADSGMQEKGHDVSRLTIQDRDGDFQLLSLLGTNVRVNCVL
jgi:hypothetical protein